MIIQKRIFVCLDVIVDLQFGDGQQYRPEEDETWKQKVIESLSITDYREWFDPQDETRYLEFTAKPLFVLPMITQ